MYLRYHLYHLYLKFGLNLMYRQMLQKYLKCHLNQKHLKFGMYLKCLLKLQKYLRYRLCHLYRTIGINHLLLR